jgi:hypothetical protein
MSRVTKGRPQGAALPDKEAVKILSLDFPAPVFSVTYWRKNRVVSMFSRLQTHPDAKAPKAHAQKTIFSRAVSRKPRLLSPAESWGAGNRSLILTFGFGMKDPSAGLRVKHRSFPRKACPELAGGGESTL